MGIFFYGSSILSLALIPEVVLILIGVFVVITARALFKMKKEGFRNILILAALIASGLIYTFFTSTKTPDYFDLGYPVVLVIIAFLYRNRFTN
jgi:hypothetical protein